MSEANFKWFGTVHKDDKGYCGIIEVEIDADKDRLESPHYKTHKEANDWCIEINKQLLTMGKQLDGKIVYAGIEETES